MAKAKTPEVKEQKDTAAEEQEGQAPAEEAETQAATDDQPVAEAEEHGEAEELAEEASAQVTAEGEEASQPETEEPQPAGSESESADVEPDTDIAALAFPQPEAEPEKPVVVRPPEEVDSKYGLVVLAAKRAKQLREGAKPLIPVQTGKVLTVALREIDSGEVTYHLADEDSETGDE